MAIDVKQSVSGIVHSRESLVGKLGISTSGITDQYSGPYVVIPKVEEQVLKTKQKVMTNDLTVKGVPVYEVSNTSGGTTVYIAKE